MLSLKRIRETKQQNEDLLKKEKENYKSPSGSKLFGKFMKSYSLDLINTYADDNDLSESHRSELKKKYHKLAFYMPTVTYSKKKEASFIENNYTSLSKDEV